MEVQENLPQHSMTYIWKCKRTCSSVACTLLPHPTPLLWRLQKKTTKRWFGFQSVGSNMPSLSTEFSGAYFARGRVCCGSSCFQSNGWIPFGSTKKSWMESWIKYPMTFYPINAPLYGYDDTVIPLIPHDIVIIPMKPKHGQPCWSGHFWSFPWAFKSLKLHKHSWVIHKSLHSRSSTQLAGRPGDWSHW